MNFPIHEFTDRIIFNNDLLFLVPEKRNFKKIGVKLATKELE